MEDPKAQLLDKLKTSNNILVTVGRGPSVDQLAALLGLTLVLNKQNKHAAAVFSGEVPSTIEFLKPEETIETNTDSLRDFIIALDKSKADKLRYKVEDDVVRIFITPYKTSISEDDLDFSQGDFNVDLVVALGVQKQEDVDEAIVSHGRILHDATVASVNIGGEGGLGSIIWNDPQASSLCELVTELAQGMGEGLLDNQVATALLTGIVAETERFSNAKTSAHTMNASAALMAAGANQQLVAEKLEEPAAPAPVTEQAEESSDGGATADPGTLEIEHAADDEAPAAELPPVQEEEPEESEAPQEAPAEESNDEDSNLSSGPKLVTEPPTLGGALTANAHREILEAAVDPLSQTNVDSPLLSHDDEPAAPESQPPAGPGPEPVPKPEEKPVPEPEHAEPLVENMNTLSQLEEAVKSPHLADTPEAKPEEKPEEPEPLVDNLNAARTEVDKAILENPSPQPPKPIQSLNATPMVANLNDPGAESSVPSPEIDTPPAADATPSPVANSYAPSSAPLTTPQVTDSTAPPPVPPPLFPTQLGAPTNPGDQNQQQ